MTARYLTFGAGEEEKKVPLEDRIIFIGRKPMSDIFLGDPSVSKEHAVIYLIGKEAVLEDLRSLNGTFVNGERIMRHTLSHGDIIRIGKTILRFSQESETTE
jgi:pSer/pThr/pTyr-binding forkhead associated (FHA) protein